MNVDARASGKLFGQVVMERRDIEQALAEAPALRGLRKYFLFAALGLVFSVMRALDPAAPPLDWVRYVALWLGVTVFAVVFIVSKTRAARTVLEGKTPSDLQMKLELDADGYAVSSPSSESRSAWRSVHHFVEAKSAFLIYPNPTVYQVWPKRAFADSDLPRVRALLDAHVKPATSHKKRVLWVWAALVIGFAIVYQLFGQHPS